MELEVTKPKASHNSAKASALVEGRVARAETPLVGRVLRRAREYRNLSLREVERRIGRSNAYLSQVERGLIRRPDLNVLLELSDLYQIDFMMIALWAGWVQEGQETNKSKTDTVTPLLRRVLELNETQRTKVLSLVEEMLRGSRT
jgi:HTH-type transcriptional regulator, competence development regulator